MLITGGVALDFLGALGGLPVDPTKSVDQVICMVVLGARVSVGWLRKQVIAVV